MENKVLEKDIKEHEGMTKEEILKDYEVACRSRQASLFGRKEVFMGKAKFGIFGDGKEVAQLAMAKFFQPGDFRSGYYRDQTFMFAIGESNEQQFFAQLYAHTDVNADPHTAGRGMNSHYATRIVNNDGSWNNLTQMKNTSSDISPTAAQMPRLVGLGYASKLYRDNPELHELTQFSNNGNEIAFGTIGNASCAEGIFFESINAAGVLKIPMLTSVWDDGYGISVPNEYQVTKGSISEILSGLQRKDKQSDGFEIFVVNGWDYPSLVKVYKEAAELCRKEHVPVIIHVVEVTQPQGHSTSGSHERYKSKERLEWEREHDCLKKMREWILNEGIALDSEVDEVEARALKIVKDSRTKAWKAFVDDNKVSQKSALKIISGVSKQLRTNNKIKEIKKELEKTLNPMRSDAMKAVKKTLRALRFEDPIHRKELIEWVETENEENKQRFNSHLYSESPFSALNVEEIPPHYDENSNEVVDGREVVQACFDSILARDPRVFAIGEDLGKIGDVNQGFAGLQNKYGELRVTDTGIRETTILGQGIGAALRGLRPIIEIQYLDYIYYALQTMTDDLACLQYRTKGGQTAPVIIRTRGHRLEGIWHSGSPMSTLLGSCRGIYLLVPRNMTKAAGFYNTLLQSDDPAIMIESLNGYRLKERLPGNIGEFTVPLGVPEVIREGKDITVVTYGSMCRIVMDAAAQLDELGLDVEVIDVQTLLPFDRHHKILDSIKKTNRVLFTDEDVPGGATAYMMQKVIEEQDAYQWLDSKPVCLSAEAHRPAYGSDGDYFSKPNIETIVDKIYEILHESDPQRFPAYLK
ncbi:alpha-ketoacid dehydrogenase subunit alpha/beta [Chondrinema litorale]|uniref:alpha-ketoacid dehydrogenase subunit alpha/beta n=1 Tax=Chondrinema litorale TaxID=2994555 RepID=UPI0025441D7C|nr:alpha-ketoacid dehydrogenase subunit alpha/beta [Chondrinema litorale]UZR93806.1 thiamine pyrophosphate-dependent enzyme [Chondrinema litorale]